MNYTHRTTKPHADAFPVPECDPRDAARASAVAGCGTRASLLAVKLIETASGLRSALARERNTLARSAIIAALERRIREGGAE